jgi:hypothetical protein
MTPFTDKATQTAFKIIMGMALIFSLSKNGRYLAHSCQSIVDTA